MRSRFRTPTVQYGKTYVYSDAHAHAYRCSARRRRSKGAVTAQSTSAPTKRIGQVTKISSQRPYDASVFTCASRRPGVAVLLDSVPRYAPGPADGRARAPAARGAGTRGQRPPRPR